MTFIFDVKIDVNMCEPHCVNLFFVWTSSTDEMFDFFTFDIFLQLDIFFPKNYNFIKKIGFFWKKELIP